LVERGGVRGAVERLVDVGREGEEITRGAERVDPVHISRGDRHWPARPDEVFDSTLTHFPHGLLGHSVRGAGNMVHSPRSGAGDMVNGLADEAGSVTHGTANTVEQAATGTSTTSGRTIQGVRATLPGRGQQPLAAARAARATVGSMAEATARAALEAAEQPRATATAAQVRAIAAVTTAGSALHAREQAEDFPLAGAATAAVTANLTASAAQAARPGDRLS